MRRIKELELKNWHFSDSKKPLILRGARQVGKSTLVRLFAKQNGLRLLEINLEKRKQWNKLFEQNDVQKVIDEVEGLLDVKIDLSSKTQDVLFFDECQATPFLLGALRYFYEEYPQLSVIAAGSLLEFALEKYNSSLPVGRVEFMHLGPMNFQEYLWAMGEENLAKDLAHFDFKKPISQSLHERALRHQRQFLFIGGMPEAVLEFSKSNDPKRVRKILSEILDLYKDDFNKYSRESFHPRLELIIDYALSHVGEKVKYTNISRDYEAKELRRGIQLLSQAKLLSKVQNVTCQGIPLQKGIQENTFKLLFLDVGLINIGLRFEWNEILNMSERVLLHEGPLAEQFVGQNLRDNDDTFGESDLYYWLREGKSDAAEVDFVAQKGLSFVAIEVKSGTSGSMRSLHQWNKDIQYLKKHSLRFDLNLPSRFQVKLDVKNYDLISLPLYLAAFNPLKYFNSNTDSNE
ncbi:MAG TPA: AAA family ATPase [Pseudobdellovibrionaceae bacterium]|mgnify:CR=1 FL=1|nr:AAA family ATPase [Pseudobdellovibrionaceae bacterium]